MTRAGLPRPPRHLLVLTYWSHRDALVQTYVRPYLRMIRRQGVQRLWLVTLESEALRMGVAEEEAARAALRAEGIEPVFLRYRRFGLAAAAAWSWHLVRLARLVRREAIEVIHAWCTPAGAIGYVLSVLTGRPLVVDSFEPHAEAMVENGTWRPGSAAFRILWALERRQTHRASALIALTAAMRDYARRSYGLPDDTPFFVKPALVDTRAWSEVDPAQRAARRRELGLPGGRVALYAGKVGGIYLEAELFRLFRAGQDRWGTGFRVLMLSPTSPEAVARLAAQAGLDPACVVLRFVPHAEVAAYMTLADFAVNPVKPVPTKRYCTSIKDGEYWAMGLPVILPPGIADDSDIVREADAGVVWDDFSQEGCRRAVEAMDRLLAGDREALARRVRAQAERFRDPTIGEEVYRRLYG